MRLPDLVAYQAAVQHPSTAFSDPLLKAASVATNQLGLPRAVAGNFAVAYQLRSASGRWAVRCFHRDAADRATRYAAISRELSQSNGGPLVDIEYQHSGVRVGAAWYPITRMPWVDGHPLNIAVERNLAQPDALRALERRFVATVQSLRARGIAHGDLQHGNILVDGSGALRLVDYDGMFVPALRGRPASESGDPNYQHPQRTTQFDADLDRFASIVIVLTLRALAVEPALWRTHNTGDNLLFRRADLADPMHSRLFNDLLAIPSVRPFAERFGAVCTGDYAQIPTLDTVFRASKPPASTAARSWRIHRASVQIACAITPTVAITADALGKVSIRSLSSGRTERTLHVPNLCAVATQANGALQVVTSDGPRLLIGGREVVGGVHAVRTTALSPDAEWLAAIGDDRVLRVWKLRTGRACDTFAVPNASCIAISVEGRLASVTARGSSVRMWHVRGRQHVINLEVARGISCLAFSGDGRRLAVGTTSGALTVWNVDSRQLAYTPLDLGSAVASLALSFDGTTALASTSDGAVCLRHLRGKPSVATLRAPEPLRIVRLIDWLRRVALL
jgi:WD domain, G-beta repeat